MKLLRAYLSFLDAVAPSLAAKKVYQVMSNPRIKKLRNFETEVLDQSVKITIKFKQFDIQSQSLIGAWMGRSGR